MCLQRSAVIAVVLFLGVVACGGSKGASQSIHHDFDQFVDFKKYSTFTFTKSPAPPKSSFAGQHIKKKIGQSMLARGYLYQPNDKADIIIRWYTVVEGKDDERVGTLVIEVIDRKVLDVVWKGWVTDGLTDDPNVKQLIDQVVRDTMNRFATKGSPAPGIDIAAATFDGADFVLAQSMPSTAGAAVDELGFAKPGPDDVDDKAPPLNYVWEDGYELDGKTQLGFYRLKDRDDSAWVAAAYTNERWVPPHWQPAKPKQDLIRVYGFRGSDGFWVTGHWRERLRKEFVWLPEGKDDDGNIIAGYWKPTAQKRGMVWSRGHRTPEGSWVPGFWRPNAKHGFTWVEGGFAYGHWVDGGWQPVGKKADHVWVYGYWHQSVWVAGYWRPVVRTGYYWIGPHWSGGIYVYGVWAVGVAPVVVHPVVVYRTPVVIAYRAPYVHVYVGHAHVGYHHHHYRYPPHHYNTRASARVNRHHRNMHRSNRYYRGRNPSVARPRPQPRARPRARPPTTRPRSKQRPSTRPRRGPTPRSGQQWNGGGTRKPKSRQPRSGGRRR